MIPPLGTSRFIVLEGIDGSGTTTQAELLAERLRAAGAQVHLTREPSTGPVGKFLRRALTRTLAEPGQEEPQLSPFTMALLFAADRRDHADREILPALAAGKWVISDRYDLSSLIYQSATYLGDLHPEAQLLPWLRAINQSVPRPALTLVLDLDADLARRRRQERGGEPELFEQDDLQVRLSRAYRNAQAYVPGDLLEVLPADQDRASLCEALLARVRAHLMSPSGVTA